MKTHYVPPLLLRQILAWVFFRIGGLYVIVGMDVGYWWVYFTTPLPPPPGDLPPAVFTAIITTMFVVMTIFSTVVFTRLYLREMLPCARQIIDWK